MDIEDLHNQAIKENKSYYIDPATGSRVYTSIDLNKRKCCGNGCRHCPYK